MLRTSFLVVVLAACGDDEPTYTISDQPLQGVIGGASWTFSTGETDAFLSDSEEFFTTLFAEAFTACSGGPSGANHMLLGVPTSTGEVTLGLEQNVTFYTAGENLVATKGLMRVDSVTASSVTAGLYAEFNDANRVDGNFTATICP